MAKKDWPSSSRFLGLEERLKRHFGGDQSVWCDGDWNSFVRIAVAGLLAPMCKTAVPLSHYTVSVSRIRQ